MLLADAFKAVRTALEGAGIRYAVGGSWASTAFGEPRFTNDVDIIADVTTRNLNTFLSNLAGNFYADSEEALSAISIGRPFNVIHMPTSFKFDLFPASAFPLGLEELDRALQLADTGLSKDQLPFVTPEDILLAKIYWLRLAGDTSEVQWRDIAGIIRQRAATLDRVYLERGATKLGVSDLLERAFAPANS